GRRYRLRPRAQVRVLSARHGDRRALRYHHGSHGSRGHSTDWQSRRMNDESLFNGSSDDGTFVPFTDILFNALLGFAVMLFIAFALIKPDDKVGNINIKAEYLITVTWPDNLPDDIDTYVRDPQDNIVWYNTLDRGFLHLDRDDRGEYLDQVMVNGEKVTFPLN